MKRQFIQTLKENLKDKPKFLQILIGPRQVGKTTGVLQLLKDLKNKNSFYFSADEILSQHHEWLKRKWNETRLHPDSILVIDEIQLVPNWSSIVKYLWDEDKRNNKNFHVILLGSSAMELHQGLSESLAGRFELTFVHHLNYKESIELSPGLEMDEYLKFGGYPELLLIPKLKRLNYLINSIIEPVITKDILQNVTVKKPALFKQSFDIACSYGGQVLSYNKFLGQLQEGGNIDLVKYYLNLFEKAFLIKCLQKFSTSSLQKRGSSPKILPLSLSFSGLLHELNPGRLFEIAVGIELYQMGYELFYWREGNYEVDYVFYHHKKIIAVEVKSSNKKDFVGLEKFREHFPKAQTMLIDRDNFERLKDSINLV